MNNTRRKQINNIIEQTKSIQSNIEEIRIDEETALDNMPENLKEQRKSPNQEQPCDIRPSLLRCGHQENLSAS